MQNKLQEYYFVLFAIAIFSVQTPFSAAQQVQLAWTPSKTPNIIQHNVYRSIDNDSSFVLLSSINMPDSTHTDSNIQNNTHYFYVATAVDQFGNESGFSNRVDTTLVKPVSVELGSFSVTIVNENVVLMWETVTESNNFGFEIQKSENKVEFMKIGFVRGNDTTLTQKKYTFTDTDVKNGNYYYRLKQIDENGTYEYSHNIKVTIGIPFKFDLEQNYPNPFNPSTTIAYSLPKSCTIVLKIFNMKGQIIDQLVNEFQQAGRHTVVWDGKDLNGDKVPSGEYIYKIEALETAVFRKMMIIK